MKATTSTPNTLFLALWLQNQKSVILGNFRSDTGMEPCVDAMGPLLEGKGDDPFTLLATTLADAKPLCARHIVVFTNDTTLADVFTFPIHLEPKSPDRMHLCVPAQWEILRSLCLYDSWQFKHADKLPKALALWEETYAR